MSEITRFPQEMEQFVLTEQEYYKNMNYAVASLVVISIIIAVFIIEFISNSVRRVIL